VSLDAQRASFGHASLEAFTLERLPRALAPRLDP
jgi:hypothetical protein